jgi:Protein of unknown function (DUF3352)
MKSLVKGGVTAALSLLLTSFLAEATFALTVEKQPVLSLIPTNNARNSALNDTVEILEAQVGLAIPKTGNTQERSPATKLVKEKIQSVNRENAAALQAVAHILPDNTPLVGLVNMKAGATLGRFQLFQTIGKAMSTFLPAGQKFDYTKEIGSWSGDRVAIAFLPKVDSTPATLDSGYIMLAPVKDEVGLQSFLSKFKADPQRFIERQYKGINILEIKPPSTPPTKQLPQPQTKLSSISKVIPKLPQRPQSWVVATLPGYVVTGTNTKAVEQLIDTYSGDGTTLAENPRFQQTVQHQQAGQVLFTLYENPATFLPLLPDLAKDPRMPFPLLGLSAINAGALKEFGIDGFVTLQPEGLRFQVNAYHQKPKSPTVDPEGTILSHMPGATYTAFTGRHLNQKWQNIAQVLSFQPKYKNNLAKFRQEVRSKTGLDLDRDILGWMDGEYGFFLFPTQGGVFNTGKAKYNFGLGLAVQTSNRATADNTTLKLEAYIKSVTKGFLTVNTRTIKGHPVTSWDLTGTTAPSVVAYSWVDNNTLILTSGLGAIADLVPQPQVSLPFTYNFTTATNSLPHDNHGYFYMNMGSFLSWVYGFIPPKYNNQSLDTFKQAIGSIYSISSTSSSIADRDQFDFLVVLAPVRKQK